MLLLLLYSHRVLSREKNNDFLRPTAFLKEPGRPWYTCVEPTVVGGSERMCYSERLLDYTAPPVQLLYWLSPRCVVVHLESYGSAAAQSLFSVTLNSSSDSVLSLESYVTSFLRRRLMQNVPATLHQLFY